MEANYQTCRATTCWLHSIVVISFAYLISFNKRNPI